MLEHPQDQDGDRHGGGLVAFADQVQDAVPAERLGVVLDPDRCRLGGSQGVDAKQVGESAVVDGDRLRDLEEPDEFESVESLGAGLPRCTSGNRALSVGSEDVSPSM